MAGRHALSREPPSRAIAEARHFDGGHGGVVAFVAVLAARARFGLFQSIGGEHAEGDRQSGFERHLLQSPRGFAGDVIEMRRFAANHRAQRDDRVITPPCAPAFSRPAEARTRRERRNTSTRSALASFERMARAREQFFA